MDLKKVIDRKQVYSQGAMLLLENMEEINLEDLEKWVHENLHTIGAHHIQSYLMRNKEDDMKRILKELGAPGADRLFPQEDGIRLD